MSCNRPTLAYRPIPVKGSEEKIPLVFDPKHIRGKAVETVRVKCGRCLGCKEAKSKEWALRCVHEAELYGVNNCFLTLTFNRYFLPESRSLEHKHFTRFMARFRKTYKGAVGVIDEEGNGTFPIRYFHVGEYGSKRDRPHHHACIFNFRFDDMVHFKHDNYTGSDTYLSEKLMDLWSVRIRQKDTNKYPAQIQWLDDNNRLHARLGNSYIGEVNFKSAAYLARYMVEKKGAKYDKKRLTDVDMNTGELIEKIPEYQTMSKKPGIGADWFAKHHPDCFPKDFTTHSGKKYKIPLYYEKLMQTIDPQTLTELKERRQVLAAQNQKTQRELDQREANIKSKFERLKRG